MTRKNRLFLTCATLLIGTLGLIGSTAQAQARLKAPPKRSGHTHPAMPGRPAVPASFSNSDFDPPARSKNAVSAPVPQQDLAEAILADALHHIWEQADVHWHEGEWNHTINLYRIVVQGDPKNTEAYDNSAWLLWSSDRSEEAIAFLKQGLKANPNTWTVYDDMGNHYWVRMRDPKSAIPYYEQAVKLKATWITWNMLARCYERTNQWEKAVKAWETAVKFTDNVTGPRQLERARAELARRQGGNR